MFMWTTIVNSLSQVADHPMSSPCWVDRAGSVLAYHAFERRCACFFSYDISSSYNMIVLHTPGLSGLSSKQIFFWHIAAQQSRETSGVVDTLVSRS